MANELIYYTDNNPGIRRRRCGKGFTYIADDGTRIKPGADRERITAIAIPPAYSDVWIAPFAKAHLWATGRDDKRRKQYIYNPAWTEQQSEAKFAILSDLATALPSLRRWISHALRGDPTQRETQIAAALALIDRSALRPGHASYAQQNGSYGVTTLRGRHFRRDGDRITLKYTAKGGKQVTKTLHAPRLSRVLEKSKDLPGAQLFTYRDEAGGYARLTSDHLIDTLREQAGPQITPKTLRTWQGTLVAFNTLRTDQDSAAADLARAASDHLHNTPAIARSSYIHPDVLSATDDDAVLQEVLSLDDTASTPSLAKVLRHGEAALTRFLAARS